VDVSSINAFNPTLSLLNSLNAVSSVDATQSAAQTSALLALGDVSASFETHISDVGQLISAVDALHGAAQALTQPGAFSALTATASAPQVLNATAVGVTLGSYSVQVKQLAQAQALTSAAQVTPFTPIGSGASLVNFQFANGSSRSVALSAGDNTLAGLAAAINRAALGVSASVRTSTAGAQLSLTGQTGAANAFTVSASGNTALADLLSSAPGGGLTLSASAQDAEGLVNSVAFSGGTNVVNTAVPGLALHLLATGNSTVSVAATATQIDGVQSFVKAFNQVQSSLQQFGLSTPWLGQSLSFLQSSLGTALGTPQSGLAGIGLTRNQDGTLSLNSATFQNALNANPAAVAQVFSNAGQGVAERVITQTEGSFSPQNLLQLTAAAVRTSSLFDQLSLGQSSLFASSPGSAGLLLQSSPATLASLAAQFSLIQLL
jgi:flagellar hook-associated protein 2